MVYGIYRTMLTITTLNLSVYQSSSKRFTFFYYLWPHKNCFFAYEKYTLENWFYFIQINKYWLKKSINLKIWALIHLITCAYPQSRDIYIDKYISLVYTFFLTNLFRKTPQGELFTFLKHASSYYKI